ncbi:hypothetical protein KAX97_05245 [candidate division WOR-3 bacterium]|nr:hypothetical protein [candidate division WOR-3 bacterium]
MIEDIDRRAALIINAIEGLSTFEAIGVLMSTVNAIATPIHVTNSQP